MTKRLVWVCAVLFGLGFVVLWAADGPLTPLMNLGTRTDANGYLLTTMGVYQSPETPLTPMSNLRGRTDSNGYVIISMPSGATIPVGSGAATATISGMLSTNTTSTCTVADTTETDLWSYTMPANTLATNGRGVRVTAWGNFAATANNKTFKFYFGGTSFYTVGPGVLNNVQWRFDTVVLRTGASSETAVGQLNYGTTLNSVTNYVPTVDTTGAIIIKITGTNGTAAANDICFKGALVEAM